VFGLLDNYSETKAKQGLIERLGRHFNMQKKVAEKTIEKLNNLNQTQLEKGQIP